jgi:hypothetical protein
MYRLVAVLLAGVLCATISGALELIVPEPCALEGASAPVGDGECAPTCLRCHCARPFDVVLPLAFAAVFERVEWADPTPSLPLASPRDVLHVPRPAAA